MAIKLFAYTDVSYEECLSFITWCRNELNLRDWDITFEYGEFRPSVFGDEDEILQSPAECIPRYQFLHAYVWVSPKMAKAFNVHPLELLAHEMLHVMFSIIMGPGMDRDIEDDDVLITRLEGLLVRAYTRYKRKKLPKLLER